MWKQIKAHPRITLSVLFLITLALTILIGGYRYQWAWTGLTGNKESYKTLYDWLQLLFIPVVLAVAGFWFNHRERRAAELRADMEQKAAEQREKAEREISEDNQREAALQSYISEMSQLLLHENLRSSKEDDEVRNIARVLTLTVLPRLNDERKMSILQFLHESCLIKNGNRIIDLTGVYLANADLAGINLMGDDLSLTILAGSKLNYAFLNKANFKGAILNSASLIYADLRKANLEGADLLGAKLNGANFIFTNLIDASVTDEQLKETKSLKGATMTDGSILP